MELEFPRVTIAEQRPAEEVCHPVRLKNVDFVVGACGQKVGRIAGRPSMRNRYESPQRLKPALIEGPDCTAEAVLHPFCPSQFSTFGDANHWPAYPKPRARTQLRFWTEWGSIENPYWRIQHPSPACNLPAGEDSNRATSLVAMY